MYPSEALLAGIPLCQPWTYELLVVNAGAHCGCALGTMYLGYTQQWEAALKLAYEDVSDERDLLMLIPLLNLKGAAKNKVEAVAPLWAEIRDCPECRAPHWAGSMMVHLNDDHGWTREQVVTWLQGVGL